jgi:hypothetical protein
LNLDKELHVFPLRNGQENKKEIGSEEEDKNEGRYSSMKKIKKCKVRPIYMPEFPADWEPILLGAVLNRSHVSMRRRQPLKSARIC